MKRAPLIALVLGLIPMTVAAGGDETCRYLKMRKPISGYEYGGPFSLDHFRLKTGRTDLRQFLWRHWYGQIKGIAEVRAGTVDRGTVRVLYIVQPDEEGHWGI